MSKSKRFNGKRYTWDGVAHHTRADADEKAERVRRMGGLARVVSLPGGPPPAWGVYRYTPRDSDGARPGVAACGACGRDVLRIPKTRDPDSPTGYVCVPCDPPDPADGPEDPAGGHEPPTYRNRVI